MSEYPVNSTAKQYFDCDGNPITLYRLVRSEPDWAVSRIKDGEKAIAHRETLLSAIDEVLNSLDGENYMHLKHAVEKVQS